MKTFSRHTIVARVLEMLTGGSSAPVGSSLWLTQAKQYLFQCSRMFTGDDTRLRHVELLARVVEQLPEYDVASNSLLELPFESNGDAKAWAEAVNALDPDSIAVSFHILGKTKSKYVVDIRAFLYERLRTLISDPQHLRAAPESKSRFELVAASLQEPLQLTRNDYRALSAYVHHGLDASGRDRKADVQGLMTLWKTLPENAAFDQSQTETFSDAMVDLANTGRRDMIDLAFEIMQCYDQPLQCSDLILTRMARMCALDCLKGIRNQSDVTSAICLYGYIAERLLALVNNSATPTRLGGNNLSVVVADIGGIAASTAITGGNQNPEFAGRVLLYLSEMMHEFGGPQFRVTSGIIVTLSEQGTLDLDTADKRGRFADALTELFGYDETKQNCLGVLRRIGVIDDPLMYGRWGNEWGESVLAVCRNGSPREQTACYAFEQLFAVLETALTKVPLLPMQSSVQALADAARDVFDEKQLERLVNALLRLLEADKKRIGSRFDFFSNVALMLSRMLPPNDPRRNLIESASSYYVVQEREPFYTMLNEVCFGLLLIQPREDATKERCNKMARRIRRLNNEDSGSCPAGRHEEEVLKNLKIVRYVLNRLEEIEAIRE